MRRLLIFLTVCLIAGEGIAQTPAFVAEASLPPVTKDGFYEVEIVPALAVYLNGSFGNIRLYDAQHHEVPYLLREESVRYFAGQFTPYEILEKKQEEGCCTSLILHNPKQSELNSIQLVIRNAEVTKEATLLGSDDRKQWFALKQHFLLSPSNTNGTSEVKIVDFPLSNYRYYSLRIADSTSAPLNILNAGYTEDNRVEEAKFTEVPVQKITTGQKSGEKNTYITLRFDTARLVDKLELKMKGAPYFLRHAVLYEPQQRISKKGETSTYYNRLQEMEVNSHHPTTLEFPALKVKEFLIVIENQDNPPLEVAEAKPYQRRRYLTAYLKSGTTHTLDFGPESLSTPAYDLAFFKDSIPDQPQVIDAGAITVFKQKQPETSPTFFTTKAFIWAAVIGVIAVLGFMSVKLLKETNAEKKEG
jgi:hypothetical protein